MAFETFNVKAVLQGSVTGTEQFDRFGAKLNSVGKTADIVNKQMAGLQASIRSLASAFGGVQLASLAAEFARVTIQIDAFQKQLSIGFGEYNTIELEKLRNTMRDLGIAQDEALGSAVRFTSALKLSGQSMAETNKNFEAASKLILSNKLSADGANRVYYAMAQIASKGKLMSEELSGQLAENLAGIREQVAAAMGKAPAQLLDEMSKGKVTAQEFFDALQKIGDGIDPSKLESAAMSLGKMKNAWYDFKTSVLDVGAIKAALDLTTSALILLKDNAELLSSAFKGIAIGAAGFAAAKLLAPAFAAIGLAARAAAAEVVAATAFVRAFGVSSMLTAASSINLSRAMALLGAAGGRILAIFGGPLGIALTAVAGGFYAVYSASQRAADNLQANAEMAEKLGVSLSAASQQALKAANENAGVGTASANATPAIWSFKNSVDNLTESQWKLASAARAARVELLQQQLAEVKKRRTEDVQATWAGSERLKQEASANLDKGDLLRGGSQVLSVLKSRWTNILSGGRSGREAARNVADADILIEKLTRDIVGLLESPIGRGDVPQSNIPKVSVGSPKSKKGPTPLTEVQLTKNFENMRDDYTQATLKAQRELTNTIEDRYKNQTEALASDIAAKSSDIAAAFDKKRITEAQRNILAAKLAEYTIAQSALIEARKADETAREANALIEIQNTTALDVLKIQENMASTAEERKAIQKKILAAEIALQVAKEDEIIASQGATADEKARARARRASIIKVGEEQGKQVDYNNRDAVQAYGASLVDTASKFKEAWANSLKATEDAIVNFVMTGKLSFKSLATSIIADMVRIAIQQAIIRPFMTSLGFKFAKGGVISGGDVQAFATGGVVTRPTMFPMARGKMGLMGEAGPEAIMPLRRLGNGRLGVEAVGGGTQNVAVTVNVEGGQSQVQGDAGKASQLGQLVAQAVRNELVVQKRPGGLLAAA